MALKPIVKSADTTEYAKSILPDDYTPKDLYFLAYPSEGYFLATLQDPFNFSRYFWRLHVQYLRQSAFIDPTTWLYHTVRDIGTDVVKDYMNEIVKITDNTNSRLLSDISFLLFVEGSVLNSDVVFGHCKINDTAFISQVLSSIGCERPDAKIEELLLYVIDYEAKKFKIL